MVLVTGGYRGLGHFISRELKNAGYYVVATYRTDMITARRTAIELQIPVYKADLTQRDEVMELFERIGFNDGVVWAVVNNASSFPTGQLRSMSLDDFDDAFRTSVFASNMVINRALPGMMGLGGGKIVNIGMAGLMDIKAYRDVAAHAAAKTALMLLTRSWAHELLKDNIMVNMVGPGILDDPQRDDIWRERMRRVALSGKLTPPEEVAYAVRYLMDMDDITGRVIEVDPTFVVSSV